MDEKCAHCSKQTNWSTGRVSVIGKLHDGESRHEFCCPKCIVLFIKSEPAGVPLIGVLKEKHESVSQPKPAPKVVPVKLPVTVRSLAAHLGRKPFEIIHDLMEANIFATLDTCLEPEAAERVGKRHGCKIMFEFEEGHVR